MNEKILEILMQLFAIIAKPKSDYGERRGVVEVFLKRQLNNELVDKHIATYDRAFDEARKKLEKSSPQRREGAIAIRITKLCQEINDQRQLDQKQRIIVVIQVLEFCKSGGQEVSTRESGFIRTLADGLNITNEEYEFIEKFILNPFTDIPSTSNLLIFNDIKDFDHGEAKHVYKELLKGQIWILFVPSVKMYFVRYLESGELSMNGQLLQEDKSYPFSQGSSIKGFKITPIYYWDVTVQFLKWESKESRVVYEVNNIEYRFRSGKVGIHHMSFREESGRMVGIMGASGSGKSTLLSVLNGTNVPYDGEVLINGINIHKEKEKIKGLIGYVSQDDLLIEELTVFENLYFNSKLCFDNLTEEEIVTKVDSVLKNLGLYEIRDMKVGSPLNKKISGGQRKRLNISLELIREPAIMFLDEPTSGLSSSDSENILDLLKELARKGKLLFIVIHQPSSDIFKMFDKLIILDTGGYLIYNGNPIDSIQYFKRKIEQANYYETECYVCGNVNPEQIFNIVETRVFTESGQPTETRRISPEDWSNHFKSEKKEEKLESGTIIPEINFKTPNKLKQLIVFVKRDVLSKITDTQYLLITLLEAPILAFFLAFLIRYFDEGAKNPRYTLNENSNLPVYIFMSVIIAIFMGLTVSAEEIIKDRKILKREAFLNLSWNSYLMSKVFVQFTISAIQAFTFVIIGNSITGIKEMMFQYWLVLFSCWAGANMMGLLISDSFKTVVTIYILIPFLIIPQIILSGVIVRFEKLNPNISSPVSIPIYGEFITARWGYEALAVNQFIDNKFERQFYIFDKAKSKGTYMKNLWYDEIKLKIDNILIDLGNATRGDEINSNILFVSNEIKKAGYELKKDRLDLPDLKFDYTDYLTPEKITSEIAKAALNYVEKVKYRYIEYYNSACTQRDDIINRLKNEDNKTFLELRSNYYNKSLEEFVTDRNETNKTFEYKGELIRKLDPIFSDPTHKFIRAQFYSPSKLMFGKMFYTYDVNVMVLWIMTIVLYLALYFRLLKRLLDSGELLIDKNKKGSF
jgi:ABC-type multidrug transport system ATPase subunit